jgi:hypothetical protein
VLAAERVTGTPAGTSQALFGYTYRVMATTLLGVDGADGLVGGLGRTAITVVGVLVVGLVAAALAVAGARRLQVLAMAVASAAYFTVPCRFPLENTTFPPAGPAELDLTLGGRYTIVPCLLLLTALLLAAQSLVEHLPRVRAAVVPVVVALPVVVWAATDYRPAPDLRTAVPPWSQSLEALRQACADDPAAAPAPLPLEPGGPWLLELSCAAATG